MRDTCQEWSFALRYDGKYLKKQWGAFRLSWKRTPFTSSLQRGSIPCGCRCRVRVCVLRCSDQSAWLLRFRVWLSSLPVRDCVPWDPDILAFGMKNVTDCNDFLKSWLLCSSSNGLLLGPGVQRVVNTTSSGLPSLSWTVEQKLVCPGVRAIFMVWSYFYRRLILPIGLTPTLWKRGEEKEGRASPSVLAVLGPEQQHPDRSSLLLTHFLSGRLLLNMIFHFILWQKVELDEILNFSSDASSTVLLWAVFQPTLMYTFFVRVICLRTLLLGLIFEVIFMLFAYREHLLVFHPFRAEDTYIIFNNFK